MTFCDVMLLPGNRHFVTTLVDVSFSPIFAEWRHCLWHTNSMNALVFQVFSVHFLWHFSLELYQNVRIAITRLFHCINICRSLGRCLNTPPSASCSNNSLETRQWPCVQTTPLGPGNSLVFKQLHWDSASVNAWKKRDPYCLTGFWMVNFSYVCLSMYLSALSTSVISSLHPNLFITRLITKQFWI